MKKLLKKIVKWFKWVFNANYLCELAEELLLNRRIDPRDAALIRSYIVDIKAQGVRPVIRRAAKRELKKLLKDYLMKD